MDDAENIPANGDGEIRSTLMALREQVERKYRDDIAAIDRLMGVLPRHRKRSEYGSIKNALQAFLAIAPTEFIGKQFIEFATPNISKSSAIAAISVAVHKDKILEFVSMRGPGRGNPAVYRRRIPPEAKQTAIEKQYFTRR